MFLENEVMFAGKEIKWKLSNYSYQDKIAFTKTIITNTKELKYNGICYRGKQFETSL